MRNKLKGANFIWGNLSTGGILEFVIENVPKDGTGCPGWWMFDEMIGSFGANVVAILGSWTYGDNLDGVNALTNQGISFEVAATQVPTGRFASKHGFSKVRPLSVVGTVGNYKAIEVVFER